MEIDGGDEVGGVLDVFGFLAAFLVEPDDVEGEGGVFFEFRGGELFAFEMVGVFEEAGGVDVFDLLVEGGDVEAFASDVLNVDDFEYLLVPRLILHKLPLLMR